MNRIHTEAFPFLYFNPLRREEFPGMFVERLSLPWRWHYHRHLAPRAESREAPIFQLGSRGLSFTGRTRLLYGAASFHDGPRVVEVVIPEPRDMEHLTFTIRSILDRIRRLKPSMRLCPSPGSWVKRLPGRKVRIDLLFAPTGADENTLSDEYARRNSLDHHLGRESRLLGRLDRVHIVRGNSPISDHDGAWYIGKRRWKSRRHSILSRHLRIHGIQPISFAPGTSCEGYGDNACRWAMEGTLPYMRGGRGCGRDRPGMHRQVR